MEEDEFETFETESDKEDCEIDEGNFLIKIFDKFLLKNFLKTDFPSSDSDETLDFKIETINNHLGKSNSTERTVEVISLSRSEKYLEILNCCTNSEIPCFFETPLGAQLCSVYEHNLCTSSFNCFKRTCGSDCIFSQNKDHMK